MDSILAWNREELPSLCVKNSTTSPAELKTSLQGKIRGLQILLEPTTILRATAQKGSISYIQRFNNLVLDASAIRQMLAKLEYIGATENNSFKTSLTNLKYRSHKIFANLHTQIIEELTRDHDLSEVPLADVEINTEDQEQAQPQLCGVSPRPGPRPQDPTNFIPGGEPPRSQQTSPIHESSSTRTTPEPQLPLPDFKYMEDFLKAAGTSSIRARTNKTETSRSQQCTAAPTEGDNSQMGVHH